MKYRYVIKDSFAPLNWQGEQFSSLERAQRELKHYVGRPGRFQLIDKETGECLGTN